MNPFDLTGPEFLLLYKWVAIAAVCIGLVARGALRQPSDDPSHEALDLTPYEVAYLSGGARLAIDSAIVRLVHRELLAIDASSRTV